MSNLPGNYLPGNPHMNDLIIRRNAGNDYSPTVNATLTLAYEQRTATLVHALLSDSLVTDGKYDELQAEVRKRLGLGESND